MPKPKVFISHSSSDSAFAELLRSELQQRGLDAWLDQDALHLGDRWNDTIDKQISISHAFIIVITPDSLNSSYVNYEWSFALGKGIHVIPILLKRNQGNPKHPKLEALQYIDFTNPKMGSWRRLFNKIFNEIKLRARGGLKIPLLTDFEQDKTYQSDLEQAKELWLVGVSLKKTVQRREGSLEKKLNSGHRLRVLLAEPTASVVEPTARRKYGEQDLIAYTADKCTEIEGTLRRLWKFKLDHKKGQVQIRTTKYPLGYGVHGMDPAIAGGVLYVKLYPYRADESVKPVFVLRRGRDQWYESFATELTSLWKDGKRARKPI